MDVSIIIPTHNRSELLLRCLKTLLSQISKKDEVIVVDNLSTDNTRVVAEKLSRHYPVKYIYTTKGGASGARNKGLLESTNPGVAFIDDDSLVDKNWLRNVKRLLKQFGSSRRLPVFQGKIIQHYDRRGLYELIRLDEFNKNLYNLGMGKDSPGASEIKTVIVCNIFSYRKVFTKIKGPFNSEIFPFMGEDPDIACRLIQKGVPILYAPSAAVTHAKNKSTLKNSLKQVYVYGRAAAILENLYLNKPDLILALNSGPGLENVDKDVILPSTIKLNKAIQDSFLFQLKYVFYNSLKEAVYKFSYSYNKFFFRKH